MKKIVSIIAAAVIAAYALSIVSAAQTITADEVKEIICSTGLGAYPELWVKTITELGKDEDVLNPETRIVKDIIDINASYRKFDAKSTGSGYIINNDDNIVISFKGLNKDGKYVLIDCFPESYDIDILAGTVQYHAPDEDIDHTPQFVEDYDAIAEIINDSGTDAEEIKIVHYDAEFHLGTCVYIKDSAGKEYAIPANSYTDTHAENLGREVKSIEQGKIMDFSEWCSDIDNFSDNAEADVKEPEFETVVGDEIRDTDTRAPYIGTESKFRDVSGDLVSYVNELFDLGIINGYGDGSFRPENTITRGEAASMLARMLKYEGKYDGRFNDINADDWFADDVTALADNGIISGYDDVTFAPYNEIKYQEVMKILVYALGYSSYEMKIDPSSYPKATNSMAMSISLTDGLGSFDTTAAITRGDMAVMLSNALDTHLRTTIQMIPQNGIGGGMTNIDITLIDYLNGGKLNGTLRE